jgi:hypothetical protein
VGVSLAAFVSRLQTDGVARVGERSPDVEADGALEVALRELDRRARRALPLGAPPLDLAAAAWAARVLRAAARALAFRHLEIAPIRAELFVPCPSSAELASTHASVDLCLRWLPDLLGLARSASPEDPLVEALSELAVGWPLSSVGTGAGATAAALDPVWRDPALRVLYLDRVLAAEDTARLEDPRVAEAARAALGAHPELKPWAARALATEESTP